MTDLLKEWDSNDDGRVDRKEFADGLIKMGIKATRQDFNTLFDSWDNDGGGSLDARELARALKSNDTVHSIKEQTKKKKQLQPQGAGRSGAGVPRRTSSSAKDDTQARREAEEAREEMLESLAEDLRNAAGKGDVDRIYAMCGKELSATASYAPTHQSYPPRAQYTPFECPPRVRMIA